MLKKTMSSIVILFLAVPFAFAEVTTHDIDRAIDKDKLEHPYLYFSEKDGLVLE